MATQAHCFYCFECLAASFNNKSAPTLARIEELFEQYEKTHDGSGRAESEDASATVEDEDDLEDGLDGEDDFDDDDFDEESDDNQTATSAKTAKPPPATLQPPSISRLQAPSPTSNPPTPSSLSTNSSNSALTNASSASSTSTSATVPSTSYAKVSASESYPLFVTWNTHSAHRPNHKTLRGCIGTFEAQPLAYGLKTYAITSAFDDHRFPPISASLLHNGTLSCALTLLGSFTPCSDPMDWTIGTHGLRISFMHKGRRLGATYLPDVALEQGWTKEECIESLMRKAGWDGGNAGIARRFLRGGGASAGRVEREMRPWEEVSDFKTVKYQGLKSSATWADWMAWRRWAEKEGLRPL